MNKRRWMVMILALGMALLMAGTAGAAKFKDLRGTWNGSANSAYWSDGDNGFSPNVAVGIEVLNQDDNGMFYGTFTYDGTVEQFTGSISTNKTITACIRAEAGVIGTFTGKLAGKTITGTYNIFGPTFIATATVTATIAPNP
jgi:hypothetical protein